MKSNIERDTYVRRLALDLDLREVQIYDEIKSYKLPDYHPAKSHRDDNGAESTLKAQSRTVEETLLGLIIQFPRVGKMYTDRIGKNFFTDDLKAIYKEFIDQYNSDSLKSEEDFVSGLAHELKENAALITLYIEEKYGEITEESAEKEIAALIENVNKSRTVSKRRKLQKRLVSAEQDGNKELQNELLMELNKLYDS